MGSPDLGGEIQDKMRAGLLLAAALLGATSLERAAVAQSAGQCSKVDFEAVVDEAGKTYSPALIANYVYELTKLFNRFYHDLPILKEENEALKKFRLQLTQLCGYVISNAMGLLGIRVPERM